MMFWIVTGSFAVVIVVAVAYLSWDLTGASGKDRTYLRACPICGKHLRVGENLLAERTGMKNAGREQIVIKGCPYCLDSDVLRDRRLIDEGRNQ